VSTIHGNTVIPLHLRPGTGIQSSIAVTVDVDGFVIPLVPGQNFCGITTDRRTADDDRRSVVVEYEGVTQLRVEGLAANSHGATVFAVGPMTFTLNPTGKASAIGKVLNREHDGRATVKFSV
jgi:hypothetical protein